ncbi:hypothetical protein PIB30_075692 [Stylosanthes scabra]|uniref:Uncharacterized protein n=1 Tax=Stylosanthes scabra TaxID=79078 RepID=A0ABU6TPL9_9FABA|nr:hypothetical protein [Stylosanthes scabra]
MFNGETLICPSHHSSASQVTTHSHGHTNVSRLLSQSRSLKLSRSLHLQSPAGFVRRRPPSSCRPRLNQAEAEATSTRALVRASSSACLLASSSPPFRRFRLPVAVVLRFGVDYVILIMAMLKGLIR